MKILSAYAVAAITVVISAPLASERIGPNRLYGFRTRKTLSDRDTWYKANRFAGRAGIVCGTAMALLATTLQLFVKRRLAPEAFDQTVRLAEVVPPGVLVLVLIAYHASL